ncbi:MAG TPA: hypothetical protein DCZ94_17740 [Lentisphaeria bacterium]|nr:MAG: hypothetical protein A2X48_00335 [Lentisphaerae bacterium GWF2_49_21]HBC88788.1 hypothetical protein [Lentisphaeria bacterium]
MKKGSKSKTGTSVLSQAPEYTAEENLQRLANTSILEVFVRENKDGWDHEKWLALCDKITEKGYAPIDFDKVGQLLEGVKAGYPNI